MVIRLSVAAGAAGAILAGLATSVSTLLSALAHPLSAVSNGRMDALFVTLPFLVVGMAGALLSNDAIPERWHRPLIAAWGALLAGLCLAGPLAGPYGAIFEHATGASADAWRGTWTQVVLWPGAHFEALTLGLLRLPLAACGLLAGGLAAGAMLESIAVEWLGSLRAAQPGLPGRMHFRHHPFRGLTPLAAEAANAVAPAVSSGPRADDRPPEPRGRRSSRPRPAPTPRGRRGQRARGSRPGS
jgi:hypothetical protein